MKECELKAKLVVALEYRAVVRYLYSFLDRAQCIWLANSVLVGHLGDSMVS